jgi:hypothetical protein
VVVVVVVVVMVVVVVVVMVVIVVVVLVVVVVVMVVVVVVIVIVVVVVVVVVVGVVVIVAVLRSDLFEIILVFDLRHSKIVRIVLGLGYISRTIYESGNLLYVGLECWVFIREILHSCV